MFTTRHNIYGVWNGSNFFCKFHSILIFINLIWINFKVSPSNVFHKKRKTQRFPQNCEFIYRSVTNWAFGVKSTLLLTPWCRVLLEKLTGLQLVKIFPAFHGTRRFNTARTTVRHLSLSWASPTQSIYPHPTSRRSILILSTHLRLGLPSRFFPSGFPIKILYTPLSSPIHCDITLSVVWNKPGSINREWIVSRRQNIVGTPRMSEAEGEGGFNAYNLEDFFILSQHPPPPPPVGHDFIYEVSRSHTTHHSR